MKRLLYLWRDFWRDPWQAPFALPLIVINFLGSVYGFFWYREQLGNTPLYFWPFVPDSPLSTVLFALALTVRLAGFRGPVFPAIALTASIKYGIWAVAVITHYWLTGGKVEFTETMLWLSHLGMAFQGLIYLRAIRFGLYVAGGTGAWMLLNDLMDYGAGLHPYLFARGQEHLALGVAVGLTFVISAGLVLQSRRVC